MNPFQKNFLELTHVTKGPSTALLKSVGSVFLAGICACCSLYFLVGQSNISFWLVLMVMVVSGMVCMGGVIRTASLLLGKPVSLAPITNTVVGVCSVMMVIVGLEGFLVWSEQNVLYAQHNNIGWKEHQDLDTQHNNSGVSGSLSGISDPILTTEARVRSEKRQKVLTMPDKWKRRQVSLPGVANAYYWHEVLHIQDQNKFRRSTPFPIKPPQTLRIMVVGDSLTYGYGVEETFTYSRILQEELGKDYSVEVLNLGRSGYQSQDILAVIREFLPLLHPDLVLYGVCQNDFLPTGKGQYLARGYEIPLPNRVKDFLLAKTHVSRFVSDLYDRSLRTAGLRFDFFADILEDFEGYQQRFGRDVRDMNQLVRAEGLPPVLAMVLDQYPIYGGRGYQISRVAEKLLKQAGMDVIETEKFYERFDGEMMHVSRWEGHPNERAHAIFASMILKELRSHSSLKEFQRK